MDLKETYNRIAEDWFNDHHSDNWWQNGLDTLATLLPKNGLVLDAGCGAGDKSKYFSDNGFRVIGVDFSENMIAIAKREVPHVGFRIADIRDLSNIPETFDGIVAQAVLLHIPKTEAPSVVAGFARKLKNGGYLYLSVKEKWPNGDDENILKENDYGYDYERFFSYFTLSEMETYVAEAGMHTVQYKSISRVGHTNWIQIIAQKA